MSLQPLWLRSMRTGVASCRIGNGSPLRALQQLRPHAQRVIRRMAGAKHPLVAAHRAHAAPHLVGQRLERRARDTPRPARSKCRRSVPRAFCAARKMPIASSYRRLSSFSYPSKGISALPLAISRRARRQMKAVDGVKKKERTHALVEVLARVPELSSSAASASSCSVAALRQKSSRERLRIFGVGRSDDRPQSRSRRRLPSRRASSRAASTFNS